MKWKERNFRQVEWLNGRGTIVPMSWLKAGLSGGQWQVGIYLLSLTTAKTDEDKGDVAGRCRAATTTIAEALDRNPKAIQRDIAALQSKGCIEKVYQGTKVAGRSNVYRILDGNETVASVPPNGSQDANQTVVPSEAESESSSMSSVGEDPLKTDRDLLLLHLLKKGFITQSAMEDASYGSTVVSRATPPEMLSLLSHHNITYSVE